MINILKKYKNPKMQYPAYKQRNGYSRNYRGARGGYMVCEQTQQAVPVFFIPQQQAAFGLNTQPSTNDKATHPPEYKALYSLWHRVKYALTPAEKREVFQLCEQTQNYKVENKLQNAFTVLQNTYANMLQEVVDKQMETENNLDEGPQKTGTPSLQMDVQPVQEEEKKEEENNQGLPQQDPQLVGNVTTQQGGQKEENITNAGSNGVVNTQQTQQMIDDIGLQQQLLINTLRRKVSQGLVQRNMTVSEQLALNGRRLSGGLKRDIDPKLPRREHNEKDKNPKIEKKNNVLGCP